MSNDVFNIVVGVVGILAFVLAVWEHFRRKAERAIEAERVRTQEARNKSAIRMAVTGAQTADLIVQRAKNPNSTKEELQSLARSTRGLLLYLASELEDQATVLASWEFGKSVTSSSREPDGPVPERP